MMRSPDRLHDALPLAARLDAPRTGSWAASAMSPLGAFRRELGAGCREFGAKLAAYYLVRLRVQPRAARGDGELADLVAETCRRDPRHTAFLLERLCYDFVKGRWPTAGEPRHLLDGAAADRLPERSLILLHAGLGMALSEILLRPMRPGGPAASCDAALDRFAGLVAANARPELAAVAFESLGLMVRRFLPRLHGAVESRMRDRDPRLAAFYWHGAGRAIYFLPGSFHPFPGTARRGIEACRREPPAASLRLDALAGYGFAAAMINLRHPELVARLLRYLEPHEVEALASGVAGALLTRRHTCPEDPAVGAFLRPLAAPRRPPAAAAAAAAAGAGGTADARLAELWDRQVRGPCAEALDHAYPLLRARGELAALARHCPVGTLLGSPRRPEEA
jgi:hypothetical protein